MGVMGDEFPPFSERPQEMGVKENTSYPKKRSSPSVPWVYSHF